MRKSHFSRNTISPSDLTFLFNECKRCFWLKYNFNISRPGFMPLVRPMADMQEKTFRNKTSLELGLKTHGGTVTNFGEVVKSKGIQVNGAVTKWSIKGKYDLLLTFESSSVALIDCKVTTGAIDQQKVDLYKPQLEAYAFALENPLIGEGVDVVETGLLVWRIAGANTDIERLGPVFQAEPGYLYSARDRDFFEMYISRVVQILDGPCPDIEANCAFCRYANTRITALQTLSTQSTNRDIR